MQDKEDLIHRLEVLLQAVRESESRETAYQTIRRAQLFYPYWDDELKFRLHRIEDKLDHLADRPVATCRMASEEGENVIQLMTGRGASEREKGVKLLSDWMNSPTELTIADPYLIKNSGGISESDYKNSFQGLLPSSLKKLELFIGPKTTKYQKSSIATWLNSLCKTRGIQL